MYVASIDWSPSSKLIYPNLLILAEIERCQCISTTICERTFSLQNCIKQKHRNCMLTTTLESVMRVAMEGPTKDFDSILMDAIVLWKNAKNKKKNSGSEGPGVNEVSVRAGSPPQCAPHTGSGHGSYWPSLEGGLYGRGGDRDGGEEKGGHSRTRSTNNHGICLVFYVRFLGA
jgi:hypothetical protein